MAELEHDIDTLRKRRADLLAKTRETAAAVEEQHRFMTDEETLEIQRAMAEVPEIEAEIERLERERQHQAVSSWLTDTEQRVEENVRPKTQQFGQISRIQGIRERVLLDPMRGFKNYGDFTDAVARASYEGQIDERFFRYEAAMTIGSLADGGALMPPEFSTQVYNAMNQEPVNLLAMTDQYPVVGESLTLLANGETSRVTGSRYGGIQAYWVEDGLAITDSNPKVRRIRIEPRPLHVMVKVDNSLLRNSLAVERLLNQAAPEEIVFMVNDAIIRGTGAGKPLGILNSAGRVVQTKVAAQAATTYVKGNADSMWARLNARNRRTAMWFINQDVDPQFEAMVAAGTTPAIPVFLPSDNGIPSIAMTPNRLLKGRPIVELEQCATMGTEGDVILADMKAYVTGVRGTLETAMSIHLYFDRNQSAFRFSFYVDGQPWPNVPLTPYQGSNTLSPFVVVETRS
jgi:HK97 family phage major capsid protein